MRTVYMTHARTLSELRDEFISDLHRRLRSLDAEESREERIWAKRAILRAKVEIEATLSFWREIELKYTQRPNRRESEET